MDVQIAEQVPLLDQPRELPRLRRFNLADPLAQLWCDERQADGAKDVLFVGAADPVVLAIEDAVFVELEAQALGPRAQRDVVCLAAREVVQCRPEGLGRDDPDVDLEAVAEAQRCLGRPLRRGRGHALQMREGAHDAFGIAGRDQDVEITDRLSAAPQASGGLGRGHARHRAQDGEYPIGVRQRPMQRRPPLARALAPDRLRDRPAARLSHARQLEQPRVTARRLQLIDAGHPQPFPDRSRRFRTDPLDGQDLEHARRDCSFEPLVLRELAAGAELGDVLGDASAYSGQVGELPLLAESRRRDGEAGRPPGPPGDRSEP